MKVGDLVKIVRSGSLQRMMRKHIHMALGLDVVSGKRASSKVIIYINKELAWVFFYFFACIVP